ncbi:co-chaperone YbbN [Haemophilus paracuniculus]|uniref:Co-chaperone YbbN n=1 Tax=Haemophilus paracuniculus TaxID=734 RepID=A0A1T0AQZ4_9PAST|nr:co-chaperone YbbN [Haemophilus paracuniculus]OOR98477.1 co-chaperone YbbN [Haemophilus paracuniculus]
MNQIINVTEQNFSEIWNATAEMPVVFHFMSPTEMASLEMDALLRRIWDETPNQFLLATVNCQEQPMLASQFRIQTIPTLYFFKDGHPIDMVQGAISEPEMRVRLANILPKEEELKFNQALEHLQDQRYDQALPLLKSAWEMSDKKNSDFALLYAETYIVMKQVEPAKEILKQIPIQDRDSRWHGLQAQIELLEQASESPELQQLQADYAQNPTAEIAIRLANQLHQAHKNQEALDLLFGWLQKDLNVANGELKTQFLAILSALGTDPLVPTFRRKLYSLLY